MRCHGHTDHRASSHEGHHLVRIHQRRRGWRCDHQRRDDQRCQQRCHNQSGDQRGVLVRSQQRDDQRREHNFGHSDIIGGQRSHRRASQLSLE